MLMKKKMKTKFDYQARTFGACVILMLSFTLMFISPSLDKVKEENTTILASIEEMEEANDVDEGVESFNKGLSEVKE
jgi:hypothetical protein